MTLLLKIFFFISFKDTQLKEGRNRSSEVVVWSWENCMPLGATGRKQTEGFCEQKDSKRNLRVQLENGWLRTDMKKFWMLAYGVRVYFAGDREKSLKVF